MTDAGDDPLSPPNPLPAPEDRTTNETPASQSRAATPPGDAQTAAPGVNEPTSNDEQNSAPDVADERKKYPFTQGFPDGRKRLHVLVTPAPIEPDNPDAGAGAVEPKSAERARLNAVDSYYHDTAEGAFELSNLFKLSVPQDGEEETPQRNAQIEFFRPQYLKIASDLARFDHLTHIESAANASAADQSSETRQQRETGFGHLTDSTGLAREILGIANGRSTLISSSDPLAEWNERQRASRDDVDVSRMSIAGYKPRPPARYKPQPPDKGGGPNSDGPISIAIRIALAEAIRKLAEGYRSIFWPSEEPSLPEAPPTSVRDAKQRSATTQRWRNLALTGDPRVDRLVDECLIGLDARRPPIFGQGGPFGTEMHGVLKEVANNIDPPQLRDKLGRPDMTNIKLRVEQRYRLGERVVIPDVVIVIEEEGRDTPLAIIDLKTNKSRFPDYRVEELIGGVRAYNVPIIEIRMTGEILEARKRR
jgi:hypothetical protein